MKIRDLVNPRGQYFSINKTKSVYPLPLRFHIKELTESSMYLGEKKHRLGNATLQACDLNLGAG
jgi:hypothetical protein